MHFVNMVAWLENVLYTGWIMRSGAGGKKLHTPEQGARASLQAHKSPLSASNTNPVKNFYLKTSSETAPHLNLKFGFDWKRLFTVLEWV
jgi:hypothetical protein